MGDSFQDFEADFLKPQNTELGRFSVYFKTFLSFKLESAKFCRPTACFNF